jgi:hypothetical protein
MGIDSWTNELMCMISLIGGYFAGVITTALLSVNADD